MSLLGGVSALWSLVLDSLLMRGDDIPAVEVVDCHLLLGFEFGGGRGQVTELLPPLEENSNTAGLNSVSGPSDQS